MSGELSVRANESRVVRLFTLDMPREQIRFLREEPAAVADLLGLSQIDPEHVDIIRIDDLEELGLSTFLSEGVGVSEQEIAEKRGLLDKLEGHVIVVLSRAFSGRALTLAPVPELTLAATFGQAPTDWTARPMQTDSARPGRTPPRQSRARARRIGGTIFAGFMIGITLILWAALT